MKNKKQEIIRDFNILYSFKKEITNMSTKIIETKKNKYNNRKFIKQELKKYY
jgi:hypothetical protein